MFIGALLGGLFGFPWLGTGLTIAIILARQLYYLAALRAWAEQPKRTELPEPGGVWGEVYSALLDLQRRNGKRKRRLAAIVSQFQSSAQAMPDGVVLLGENGVIGWFNSVAQSLLGLKVRQDLGQRLANFLRHPDFVDYLERNEFGGSVEIPSPGDRRVILSLRIIPYGGNQRLLLVRDVSELHRLERVRRDFVANASHELRTPLTVLRGYLEMMAPDAGEGGALAAWKGPIQEMQSQASRMEALLRDLLKLARLENTTESAIVVELDIARLLEKVVTDGRGLSAGRQSIELEAEPGLRLSGRETEVESIFSNLVSNAVQYTPEGGRIRVKWEHTSDGGARFEVQDTGIGIPADEIPRLTERFYRVDEGRSRASGGTGLGLSIVKHALERLDGRLRVESTPGTGSRFICEFPARRVSTGSVEPATD